MSQPTTLFELPDPGIHLAVELLINEGLTTCDSGDGYSKVEAIGAGEALDYGHVIVVVDQGFTPEEIVRIAQSIPWTDYGYQEPTVEHLKRDPDIPADGDDTDEVVGVIWKPGQLQIKME